MTAFHGYTTDINRAVQEALRVQLSNQQTKKMTFHTYVNIPDFPGFNSPDSKYSSIQKDSNISENTSFSSVSNWKIAEPDPTNVSSRPLSTPNHTNVSLRPLPTPDPTNVSSKRRPLPTPDPTNVSSKRRPLPTPKNVGQHFYGKSSNSGISTHIHLPSSFQQMTGDSSVLSAKNLETTQKVQRVRRLLIVALAIAIIIACCLLLLVILLSTGAINQSATLHYPVDQTSINPEVNSSQGTEEKTTIIIGEVTTNFQSFTFSIRSTSETKTNEMAKLTYPRIIIGN